MSCVGRLGWLRPERSIRSNLRDPGDPGNLRNLRNLRNLGPAFQTRYAAGLAGVTAASIFSKSMRSATGSPSR
jgi:hypothetical protein